MKNEVQKQVDTFQLSLDKRNISRENFRVIKEVLYPNVQKDETLLMAIDYCKARNLDIMKRAIQIVPIWDKNIGAMKDTIWPSITELRITAARTGQYAGKDKAIYGEEVTENFDGLEVTYPKWCEVIVYKTVNGVKCAFSSNELYWKETYKTAKNNTTKPNTMWAKRTREQLAKCSEAAALRAAFPEEIGSDYIAEEAFNANEYVKDVTPSKTANIPENLTFESDVKKEEVDVTQPIPPKEELEKKTGVNAKQPNPKDKPEEKVNNDPLTDEEKEKIDKEGGDE